jgi:intracellular multiplication protein IcmO
MMVASSQDLPSMAKGEHKEEVSSVIANTKLKISMALEDPKDTYEIFQKSGGEAFVNQISGYETKIGLLSNSIQQQMTTGIERRDRVSLEELRRLNEGQAVVLFKDRIVRLKAFWAPGLGIKPLTKIPYRVHKFLELRHPTLQDLQGKGESRAKEVDTFGHVMRLMVRGQKPMYLCEPDPVLERLAVISEELMRGGGILQQRIDAVELGIWLFEEVAYAISYGSSSIEEDRLGEGELPGMDYSDDLLDVENMINSLASPQKELAQDTREKLKVAAELMEGTSDAISELEANMMRRRMHYAPPPPPASEPINIDKIAQDINQLVNEKGETN